MNQPTGTITFLFTDIEGSTKLWEDCPEAMRLALAIHDSLLRQAIEQNNGYVFKTVGDAFCAAFPTAPEALTAANDAHFALLKQDWGETGPIRVRMGLHTGDAEVRDNDYFGPTLNRAARLQSIAYGCQTLLSQPTYELVRDRLPENVTLNPLGLHRLKDLNRAETVYQVVCPGLPSEFPALKSLESFPNNLPIQLTSFIGREREMSEIKQLLKSNRLVTLLGTGGTGKSRLSLQVGADLLEQFPDGIWFVELAPLTDSSLVPQVVASVIGVREEAGRTISHVLAESLRQRTVLIILDNCEHMLDATARLAQSLLQSCPHLTVLASSREAFTVPGEMVFRVPSLSQPEAASRHTAASLSQFEAVRLFIDRAASVNAEFAVTNSNAPALAQLCARLDGIPLAIELAAARARSLSVEEINGKLDHCFRILTGGSRTALPRQQTLRALVDWSYDLLSDPEKTLLRRVSVFYDGWTLEAAEQVCAGGGVEDWEALDLLTSLRDKSLAVTEQENGRTRYRLLETIRQYARDRLLESGEAESVQSSHYEYFNRFVEVTSVQLFGAQVQAGLDLMRGEHGNLRAALEWVIGNRAPNALRMPVAMGQFWYLGGYLREGREYLEQALASAADLTAELEGQTCFQIGRLASEQGDYGAARTFLERGLSCSQQAGDKRSAAGTLNSLGGVVFRHDDYTLARSCFEQSLALQREVGNQAGIAAALDNLGNVLGRSGDYEGARSYHVQGLAMHRNLGNLRGMATSLYNLGNICFEQGDAAAARSLFEQSLAIARELQDDWYAAHSLVCLADVLKVEGSYADARSMAQQSLAIVRNIGDRFTIGTALAVLGEIASAEKEIALARSLFTECMAIRREIGQKQGIAETLEGFAGLAISTMLLDASSPSAAGLAARAARLIGAAEVLREGLGVPMQPTVLASYRGHLSAIHEALDDETFASARQAGQAMTMDQAVEYALDPDAA